MVVEGTAAVCVLLINLTLTGFEVVIAIFVSGFSLRKIERKKSMVKSTASAMGGIAILLLLAGGIGSFVIIPKVMNRQVTMVAVDGHSLPFAALIIHSDSGDQHKRTDNAGNVLIPRIGTNSITVKDARYVEKTWTQAEVESELVVERTILGSGLDSLADRLLKPAKK
ncbi:MAG: hypothetical protein ACI9R3_005871 [Verrucomicrobiales bacterium]|jgi:hypothetical protein